MQLNFDATKYDPSQSIAKHPIGNFPAIVSEVKIDGKSDKEYWIDVTFSTPSGQIRKRYNVANPSSEKNMQQMVDIANRDLSALCHATAAYRLLSGQELVNQRLMIDVAVQDEKYNKVAKVYCPDGSEPKALNQQAPTAAQQQPAAAQGGWNNQPQQAAGNAPATGWSGQQTPPNNAPANAPASANSGGWTPGPSAAPGAPVPWGQK